VAVAIVAVVIIAVVLSLSGCAADGRFSRAAICAAAGGTYGGGECSNPRQKAEESCENSGGVYLGGEDAREFGEGGP
jgi:hypothetical protein